MLKLPADGKLAPDERYAVYLVEVDADTKVGMSGNELVYLGSEAMGGTWGLWFVEVV